MWLNDQRLTFYTQLFIAIYLWVFSLSNEFNFLHYLIVLIIRYLSKTICCNGKIIIYIMFKFFFFKMNLQIFSFPFRIDILPSCNNCTKCNNLKTFNQYRHISFSNFIQLLSTPNSPVLWLHSVKFEVQPPLSRTHLKRNGIKFKIISSTNCLLWLTNRN